MTMRSWALVIVPLFSVNDPLFEKLTIFLIWPNFKLSMFFHQLISPKLLYLGKHEDLGNGVGFVFLYIYRCSLSFKTHFHSVT